MSSRPASRALKTTEKLEVLLGQTIAANLNMEIVAAGRTVEVTAQGALLQTEDANISSKLRYQDDSERSELRRRHHRTWAQSAPGGYDEDQPAGRRIWQKFQASWIARYREPQYVNGNDYNDAFLNLNTGPRTFCSAAMNCKEVAVAQQRVHRPAGRQAGAQIDYTTKSGTIRSTGYVDTTGTGRYSTAMIWLNKALGGNAALR